jgi:ferric-dicitrate binding protein FerR (iron transport regulator)
MVTPLVLVTEFGNRSEAILPDGTKVQLNSGSELTYCYNKHKRVRNVQFSGEGYFEVKKDKKPFVIELQNGLSLQVLGTKFNLSSYPDDDMIETTLTEGRVELISSENKQLILEPGQIGSFNKKSGKLVYSQEKVSHNLGWMDRKLYMDNMSISEVCKVLERWYNIQITITQTEVVENVHYTGVLQEESVNDVLKALSEISPIKYIIEGQKITISKK